MPTIRDTIERVAPPWLRGFYGLRFLYAMAIPWDGLIDSAIEAVSAGFPGYTTNESLPYLARDRRIPRGSEESDESFAERLRLFRAVQATRGGARALLRQLRAYLTGHAMALEIVNDFGTRWSVDAFGVENFTTPNLPDWGWNYYYTPTPTNPVHSDRFYVLIHAYQDPTFAQRAGVMSDAHPFGSGTLGSTLSAIQVSGLRALITDWAAAHCVLAKTILIFDLTDWNANPPSGDWIYCGARRRSAAYLDGAS